MIRGAGDRPRILHTHCRVAYGSVLHTAGRWPEAEASMLEALGPADAPIRPHRELTVAHLAGLRVEQGRIEEAAELLAPFEDRVTSCAPLAQVHLQRGQPDLAVAVLHRGLRELVADALRIGPLLSLLVEAELQRGDIDAATAAVDRLEQLAERFGCRRADEPTHSRRVPGAGGDRRRCGCDRAVRGGDRDMLDNDERPLLLGTVRLELAEVLARSGNQPAAITEARAALACFERLGARHAPRSGRGVAAQPRRHGACSTAATRRRRDDAERPRAGGARARQPWSVERRDRDRACSSRPRPPSITSGGS